MRHLVELYGLRVSAPVPLPGLAVEAGDAPDVVVHFGERPPGADRWPEDGAPRIYTTAEAIGTAPVLIADLPAAGFLRLRYAEGIRFHVADDGGAVWADWVPPLSEADAVTFLLGPVLGIVLRRHGVVALHASAVVIRDRAWAFIGSGGSGKSTLAAACALAGYRLITEDVLAVRPRGGEWLALPAYHQVRLWDDAARILLGPDHGLPSLTPSWPKRVLDLSIAGLSQAAAPVPIGGLFVLEDYLPAEAPPVAEPMPAPAAVVELVANAYVNYLLGTRTLGVELSAMSGIARTVPTWRLYPASAAAGVAATVSLVRRIAGD